MHTWTEEHVDVGCICVSLLFITTTPYEQYICQGLFEVGLYEVLILVSVSSMVVDTSAEAKQCVHYI